MINDTLEIMLANQIWRRAKKLGIDLPTLAHNRVTEEGRRQAAKIPAAQKINDNDIDQLVNACKTMANEPGMATLASWRFLPDSTVPEA
jgi:hypothetical protein